MPRTQHTITADDILPTDQYELIRADKKRKAQERLEALLIEGLDSENSEPVAPQFWDELWGRVDARLQQRAKGDS